MEILTSLTGVWCDPGKVEMACEEMNTTNPDARRRKMPKISVFDYKEIMNFLTKNQIKLTHAYCLWRYIVNHGATDVDSIPDLPKRFCHFIKERCSLKTINVVDTFHSKDGSTTKFLIDLFDGKRVETVIMRYGQVQMENFPFNAPVSNDTSLATRGKSGFRCSPRATLCVSSQVGCAMKCRFCATGTMGLLASLTSGEILEQLYIAQQIEPIKNVVFMGMGEPLDNYKEVIDAIRLMADVRVFHLAAHHITLSTVGVVPRLKQLKRDAPHISLALSLHAPTQNIRVKIVPTARKWPLQSILDAAVDFVASQQKSTSNPGKHRRLLVEYVAIQHVNIDTEAAHQLGKLLKPYSHLVHLNVIPYNPSLASTGPKLLPPTVDDVDQFIVLVRSYDIKCTLRQTLGQDISGACGQLVVKSQEKKPLTTIASIPQPSLGFSVIRRLTHQSTYVWSAGTLGVVMLHLTVNKSIACAPLYRGNVVLDTVVGHRETGYHVGAYCCKSLQYRSNTMAKEEQNDSLTKVRRHILGLQLQEKVYQLESGRGVGVKKRSLHTEVYGELHSVVDIGAVSMRSDLGMMWQLEATSSVFRLHNKTIAVGSTTTAPTHICLKVRNVQVHATWSPPHYPSRALSVRDKDM